MVYNARERYAGKLVASAAVANELKAGGRCPRHGSGTVEGASGGRKPTGVTAELAHDSRLFRNDDFAAVYAPGRPVVTFACTE